MIVTYFPIHQGTYFCRCQFSLTFQVQNAVDFLKMIGALDENENLTHLGM